ncbi:MAG: DEAD/DEAH box helicase [Firmicutes bacterium]|nr:DEAD/DEAH box helicase [Bacillota bacterium]
MEILFDSRGLQLLQEAARGLPVPLPWPLIGREAELLLRLEQQRGLESLRALPDLQLYPHQEKAILQAIRLMKGRAILADEVGLGKTIEAGVILREYMHWGLVQRCLILTPPALVKQWQTELREKLNLSFTVNQFADVEQATRVIVSLDAAKRPQHATKIQSSPWDMVIVDEAHRLKNRATLAWKFVNQVQKTYLLLLTATPVQNDLRELYNLVTLLWPGKLQTFTQFKQAFMLDKHTPKNVSELRRRLSEVMVRSTRQATQLKFPRRQVSTILVSPSLAEREAYLVLWQKLHQAYLRLSAQERNILPMVVLLRELCSSTGAVLATLAHMIANKQSRYLAEEDAIEIRDRLQNVTGSKLNHLMEAIGNTNERAIVFTEFRRSQEQIVERLRKRNLRVAVYHGGLGRKAKDVAIEAFRQDAQILVSTEAGGEGRNLQFCRRVINYDLPWNPLRLEQRIGRVHRLGQTRDVLVVNLVLEDTIESHILYLLEKKIRMFEQVIGELDLILPVNRRSLEMELAHALLGSDNNSVLARQIENLGAQLSASRRRYDQVNLLNQAVLDGVEPEVPGGATRGSWQSVDK